MTSDSQPVQSPQALSAAVADALQQAVPAGPARARIAIAAWTDIDAWLPWRSAAEGFIDAAQAARASTLRQPGEQARRRMTYALHRLVVAHWLQRPPLSLEIARDTRGCPRLPGSHAATSLSHAAGFSAFAVCAQGPVGIDLEACPSPVDLAALAHRIAHPQELAGIDAGLDTPAWQARLLALWVRKEACLKAAGLGLTHPMEAFTAELEQGIALPGTVPAASVEIRMLPSQPNWIGAVATPAGVEVSVVQLSPPSM